jgi:chromosome segregation ATPase
MKRALAPLVLFIAVWQASAQSQSPAPTVAPQTPAAPGAMQPAPGPEDDRFPGLRENADRLKASFEKLDAANMDEIEHLLKTRRCQINRIGGLLDRTIEGMQEWHTAELAYWTKWAEVEQLRVDGQVKSLASMEADQQRLKETIDSESKDHDELLRKRAVLEQGKRTQEIIKDIDALILDIKDSEDRLAQAQTKYDEVSTQVKNMNASITARLIDIRQTRNRIEAYGLQMKAFYEDKRKSAQEVCNLKQPNTGRTPLPKSPKQNPQP